VTTLARRLTIIGGGVMGLMTAYYAAPLMIEAKRGLIANISFYGAVSYFHGAAYGTAKAGTDKMTHDMAIDLEPHGVAVVSLWPGFIMTDALARTPPEKVPEDLRAMLPQFEMPEFSGLVIDALYRDPQLPELSGKALERARKALASRQLPKPFDRVAARAELDALIDRTGDRTGMA